MSSEWILRPAGRPLFIFAHQDDETALAGIAHHVVGDDERGAFVWWTNGDGPAPARGIAPATYAVTRIAESAAALQSLGASTRRKVDLETSEIENYRRIVQIADGGAARQSAVQYFTAEAERVELAIRAAAADRVFLLAWQGGHFEHDLLHVMTVRAVRKLRRETGHPIPIVQCPAYEFASLCALRFKPWFKGDRRRYALDADDAAAKRATFVAHASQAAVFASFRRVIGVSGALGALRGRRVSFDDYLNVEEFGVVDPDFDYTRSTHWPDLLNYAFDDYQGIAIRFASMLRPVVRGLLADSAELAEAGPQREPRKG